MIPEGSKGSAPRVTFLLSHIDTLGESQPFGKLGERLWQEQAYVLWSGKRKGPQLLTEEAADGSYSLEEGLREAGTQTQHTTVG